MNFSRRSVSFNMSSRLVMGQAAAISALSAARLAGSGPNWREQNAYTLGVQAYLYAFPWAYMTQALWDRTGGADVQANSSSRG